MVTNRGREALAGAVASALAVPIGDTGNRPENAAIERDLLAGRFYRFYRFAEIRRPACGRPRARPNRLNPSSLLSLLCRGIGSAQPMPADARYPRELCPGM